MNGFIFMVNRVKISLYSLHWWQYYGWKLFMLTTICMKLDGGGGGVSTLRMGLASCMHSLAFMILNVESLQYPHPTPHTHLHTYSQSDLSSLHLIRNFKGAINHFVIHSAGQSADHAVVEKCNLRFFLTFSLSLISTWQLYRWERRAGERGFAERM